MDEKSNKIVNEEIRDIIFCKNYLGLDVFNDIDKLILIDLYGLEQKELSIELVCIKYGIDIDYINELTMTYDNIKQAFNDNSRKRSKKV